MIVRAICLIKSKAQLDWIPRDKREALTLLTSSIFSCSSCSAARAPLTHIISRIISWVIVSCTFINELSCAWVCTVRTWFGLRGCDTTKSNGLNLTSDTLLSTHSYSIYYICEIINYILFLHILLCLETSKYVSFSFMKEDNVLIRSRSKLYF